MPFRAKAQILPGVSDSDCLPFSRTFVARGGAPALAAVDPRVFTARYFGACMACGFCHDWCCQHGVDVDGITVARILERSAELEPLVRHPASGWFTAEEADEDMPGGTVRRTRVVDGACVFLNRAGRGCLLHAFALERGEDYHALKPMVSALFPITFCDGVLTVADEVEDGSLVCGGEGPSVYEAARPELLHYFGEDCVRELDQLAMTLPAHQGVVPGAQR